MNLIRPFLLLTLSAALLACGGSDKKDSVPALNTQETLGAALFNDTNLSLNRTQSCATCHMADHAFSDASTDSSGATRAVSLGDDGVSLGDRNTPTAMYAAFAPDFQFAERSRFNTNQGGYTGWLGGQFWDGRATDLEAQAGGPFLNPVEMNMPDKASVISRVLENTDYAEAFEYLYGDNIFDDTEAAYDALTAAIASFERTATFAPFSSKYDKSLTGDYTYNPASLATTGKSLFFSGQFTNCSTCHQLQRNNHREETFSGYEFHNIGVPENTAARTANGSAAGFTDLGLAANDAVADANDLSALEGKFRVPTLRNVGVTAPYMHNGVFASLDTVIRFYDKHLANSDNTINPETGVAWAAPEIDRNISSGILQSGPKLSDTDIQGLVCFLYSLTDEQFEDQLPADAAECGL